MSEILSLGEELRRLRASTGLRQIDVSELTGVPRGRLSEYENGRTIPGDRNLKKLLSLYEADEETAKRIFVKQGTWLLVRPRAIRHDNE